jgi:hypothetical protein
MRLHNTSVYLTVLVLLFALPVFASEARLNTADTEMQARIRSLQVSLQSSEISRVEIFATPARIATTIAVSPAGLEKGAYYKLVVRDIRLSLLREKLLRAIDSVEVTESAEPADVRWGLVFYNLQGTRAEAIFVDAEGRHGALGSAAVSLKGNLGSWLSRTFGDCFQ